MAIIEAPFTAEQVEKLNEFQTAGWVPALRCEKPSHDYVEPPIFVATEKGMTCPSCGYIQTWAYTRMLEDLEVWFGEATESEFGARVGQTALINVHSKAACQGRHCVIHNPSDHHMRDWPTVYRSDKGIMERQCQHNVGHPDPDDTAYQESIHREWVSVHGCDGCCSNPASRAPSDNADDDVQNHHDEP